MIGILVAFLGAVCIMFLGLGKSENQLKGLSAFILLVAGSLSFAEGLNLIHFDALAFWAPKNMIDFFKYSNSATGTKIVYFKEMLFIGVLSWFAAAIILIFKGSTSKGADKLALMMFSLTGGFIMIGASNLVMLFLGIEVLSIPLYVLAGSNRDDLKGNEAALKYFLMGSFSTAIFLLGAAFIYGGTGVLDYSEIESRLSLISHFAEYPALVKAGIILMSAGLLFKVSAFPFHFWAPDVYQGSPNRVTTFMAVIVKIAGFVAFAQLMNYFYPMVNWYKSWILVLAALTILVGNIAAMGQKLVKRTIAYSSIAHAGYLLMFLATPIKSNFWILFAYAVAYGLSSIVLFYFNDKYSTEEKSGFEMFKGLYKNNASAAWILTIALFSIAGIPITVGFTAKYYLFTAVFDVAPWVVLVALIGSAISIMYYFKAFSQMFNASESTENQEVHTNGIHWVIYVLAGLSVVLGVFPYIFERAFQF